MRIGYGHKCNSSPTRSVTFSGFFVISFAHLFFSSLPGLVVGPSRAADTGEKARTV